MSCNRRGEVANEERVKNHVGSMSERTLNQNSEKDPRGSKAPEEGQVTGGVPWAERRSQTERLVLVALFAAMTWIGAYIRLPILPDVPFTLQTLMVIMSGLFLGPRYAFYSQGLYLMMGLVGLPVFTEI